MPRSRCRLERSDLIGPVRDRRESLARTEDVESLFESRRTQAVLSDESNRLVTDGSECERESRAERANQNVNEKKTIAEPTIAELFSRNPAIFLLDGVTDCCAPSAINNRPYYCMPDAFFCWSFSRASIRDSSVLMSSSSAFFMAVSALYLLAFASRFA